MNGQHVVRRGDTIFIAIPAEFRAPVTGGCCCNYCKANPNKTPQWDTIAIDAGMKDNRRSYSTTVHFPEFANN